MSSSQVAATLEDQPVPVRMKLAGAWTSFLFLYAYVDILALYKPGVVEDILDGKVWEFAITPTWAITALTLLALPIFMVVLSLTLPAPASRATNLAVAAIQIPFAVFNAVGAWGETWVYFYSLGVALELLLVGLILRLAWTWLRTAPSVPRRSDEGRSQSRTRPVS